MSSMTCGTCGETKPSEMFRYPTYCRACRNAAERRAYALRSYKPSGRGTPAITRMMAKTMIDASWPDFADPLVLAQPEDGKCWAWQGYRNADGYGTIRVGNTMEKTHRLAYANAYGDIAPGSDIDHRCRNRSCVNPKHLEPVPHRVNVLRGAAIAAVNARKTHCKRGHQFTTENTFAGVRGSRGCVTCRRERNAHE